MGAGRRTETYLGPHFPSAGSSASSPRSSQFLNLPVGELASVIFGCTKSTYDECITQSIFGLPQSHFSYIKNIQPGMPLFLFNYSDRNLHGIFEAVTCGELNIDSFAWTGGKGKCQYPAQVRVTVRQPCSPLPEKAFKEAIAANYFKEPPNHFYFELNHVQTSMLCSLFWKNSTSKSFQLGPLAWPQPGHEEGWITPKKTRKSDRDAWDNAAPFTPTPASTSLALSEGRAKTPENWDNGSDKIEEETPAGNGVASPLHAVSRSLEPVAGKAFDGKTSVKSSNGELIDVEDDRRKAEVIEKLTQLKLKGKMQSNVETRVELPWVQGESQGEASSSSFVDSTKVQESADIESTRVQESPRAETFSIQDSSRVEWERLARERCLQEQTMLREERELLREKFQALDAPVAKAINKNLEICASAIAQMRQDQIKLRHVMDEAMSQVELLRELDQLRKKNASLENTQVQMASELERLNSEVARMSQQLRLLPSQINQMPYQSEAHMQNAMKVPEVGSSQGHQNNEYPQQVYLIGGYDGQSWLGSVDIFYPATYEITSIAPLLTARSYAAATVLMGSTYVFGGGNGRLWFETVEVYNEERDEWNSCPSMSLKRGSLAGATVGDRIFAIGGGNGEVYFSEVECYDAHLGMWISSTSMLNKRFGVAAAELNGALYAIGGYNKQAYLSSVERFDPREALWTVVAPMTNKRGSLSALTLGGKLYAIGGFDGEHFLNSTEVYEPRTNSWTEMELRMQTGRAFATVARTGNDFYIFGGLNGTRYVDTVEYYSESTGWEIVDDIALGPRCFLTSAMLE